MNLTVVKGAFVGHMCTQCIIRLRVLYTPRWDLREHCIS